MTQRGGRAAIVAVLVTVMLSVVSGALIAPRAEAAPDAFFRYSGSTPLSSVRPGTVLATRVVPYRVLGSDTGYTAVQLVYRTSDAQDRPVANATSVIAPRGGDTSKVIAYQSYYDSLNPEHSPSRSIAGAVSAGNVLADTEASTIQGFLAKGYTVIVADTEGPRADFAAGPEYGRATLDSIRAALNSPRVGLRRDARIALFGYSGGAIATAWASALAPTYAPDVDTRLVGAAEGGILVNPARNLSYVNGSAGWSGLTAMALVGLSRAYGLNLRPYLSGYGRQLLARLHDASIANVVFQYPGLTWQQLATPRHGDPNSVAPLRAVVAKVNLGSAPIPTIPLFIGQGANGTVEGTQAHRPGIGAGDGVMVAGDVRALARRYCAAGNTAVTYTQYDSRSHLTTRREWAPTALAWLDARLAGKPATGNCGSIKPGNALVARF